MAASEEDRRRFNRQVRALEEAETDEEPSPEERRAIITWLNEVRARDGIPPLRDGVDDAPELELHRIARARGPLLPLC